MAWQLLEERGVKYFQFQWKDNLAIYTTKYDQDKILKKFQPIFLHQIHSATIIDVDGDTSNMGDGLIARRGDISLGVKVADCLPVYFFTDEKICVIHCGWRSIIKGIAKKAAKLLNGYKFVLGASIGSCCYEVKKEVVELFKEKYEDAIYTKNKKFYLNLKSAVIADLGNENLVGVLDLCTYCHPEYFYSYRRKDVKKRNYALAATF